MRPFLSLLVIPFIGFLSACQQASTQAPVQPRTIVMIVAHPDDETTIGPVLAQYASTDSVYLIIATDGSFGVTDHAGIPVGDSLVKIREKEAACSCRELGIHPPIMLGLKDGLGMNGHNNFYEQIAELKPKLLTEIRRLDPDIILTFGPDGDTGHPDHRTVGNITTELLLREGLADEIEVYYYAWTREQTRKFEGWNLGYVHMDHLDTAIPFTEREEERAFASIRCHLSQFAPEEMESWIAAEKADTSNILYFRKFVLEQEKHDAL